MNHLQGPVAVRFFGGEIEVVICSDIPAAQIWAEQRVKGEIADFWRADEGSFLAAGSVLTTAQLDMYFGRVLASSEPSSDTPTIAITILSADRSEAGNIVAALPLPDEDTEGWTHPDGSITRTPC